MKKIILNILVIVFLSSCFFNNEEEDKKEVIIKAGETIVEKEKNNSIETKELEDNTPILEIQKIEESAGNLEIENNSISENLETIDKGNVDELTNTGIIEEYGDKSFGISYQNFIQKLIENPDFIKKEDCLKYDEETKLFCIDKQKEYKSIIVEKIQEEKPSKDFKIFTKSIESNPNFIVEVDCSKYELGIVLFCEQMKEYYLQNPNEGKIDSNED